MSPDRVILVDGSGYVFRAYFALRQARAGGRNVELSTSQGMPTGALHVFASMLMRLYLDERPELCAVVFDADGPTFRHALDPRYKATRKEPPEDLIPQFPWFQPIARAFRLPVLSVPGVEADDVIASLTRQARARGLAVTIFGADKDLMQLVGDHVTIVDTMKDVTYDAARVHQKFGVAPAQVGDWLALRGDSTDNIPGVAGIGEVTATKLLQQYGSIAGILAHLDELKPKLAERLRDPEQLRNLELSRRLVTLRDDVELPDVLTLRRQDWDARELARIFTTLEFSRFVARLQTTFVCDRARYVTVLDEDALARVVVAARASGELAVASITTAAPPAPPGASAPGGHGPAVARLVGVALATPGHPPAYVPVAHRYLGAPAQLDAATLARRLGPLLTDPAIVKHAHDLKAELLAWGRLGVDLRGVRCDPMVASYLLDPGAGGHDLDALARRYLDHRTVPLEELCGKGRDVVPLDGVDVAAATRWGAERADVTLALGKLLRTRLEQGGMTGLLDDVELPLAFVLAVMERTGVRVDPTVLRGLSQRIGEECAILERRIHELAGYPVNPLSPKQLNDLLFERLGLRGEKMRRVKSGGFSTDAEQLEDLADAHPIVPLILEHRELVKLKGTYLDPLPGWIHPGTGRVHTSYSQVAASTGRLASQNPNVQNIPIRTELGREVRRAFVAAPGHVLVSADYSQIELRIVAHLSQDPVLVAAFAADVDVHAQTAAEVFTVPLDRVTPDMRRVAKAVNYGLGYGQTDFGLSRALGIEREDARRYIETYFARFARVKEFMEQAIETARKTGAARTILGRRIPVPGIGSGRYHERAAAERFARNAPIQGSAADVLKLAMLRVQGRLDAGAPGKMLLTVHDELVFEVPVDRAAELGAIVREEMERAVPLSVPLKVDVGVAESWAGAH